LRLTRVNPAVGPVTTVARATAAPVPPAGYPGRWMASDHDCSDSRFGRIFSGA